MEAQLSIAVFNSSPNESGPCGITGCFQGFFQAMERLGCRVQEFESETGTQMERVVRKAAGESDVIVLIGRIGEWENSIGPAVLKRRRENQAVVWWDTGGAESLETLKRRGAEDLRQMLEPFDLVLTLGGGCRFIRAWERLGARQCVPVFGSVDPKACFPRRSEEGVFADFTFYADHLPSLEAKVEEFFIRPAELLPDRVFLLAGRGWQHFRTFPKNVRYVGPLTADRRNILNSSSEAVLNLLDDGCNGYGPFVSDHFFEAAGAAACILTEDFEGLERFLMPQSECISVQDGGQVTEVLQTLTMQTARSIGLNARRRMKAEHTCACRARMVLRRLSEVLLQTGVS